MTSDEDNLCIYNFVVIFSILNYLEYQNICLSSWILKFL
jgi:hypothetical protein